MRCSLTDGYMEPFTFTDTDSDTDTHTWGHPMSMTGDPKLFTDADTDTDTHTCRDSYKPAIDGLAW